MSFWDWLSKLLFGEPTSGRLHVPGPPGVCAYCGRPLPSPQAQQCFACGYDWRDPFNVVRRGVINRPADRTPAPSPSTPPPPGWYVDNTRPAVSPPSVVITPPPAYQPPLPPPAPQKPPPKRENKTLSGLDASSFIGMTSEQIKKDIKAGGSVRMGGAWFGRRDMIPPASDRRTALIDAGMIGYGLITPEELARIHAIGAEMDQLRPDFSTAAQLAQDAVRAAEADRAVRKAKKKAEAAEKKQRRAAEIAARKLTDIIYLGRGVSRGLADRRIDLERLQAGSLPILATPKDIATALGISIPRLRWLAFHNEAATRLHYIRFTVPKKSGGTRELAAPHKTLAACQLWILDNILRKVPAHDAAHGFIPSRSTVTCAAAHVGKHTVLNADLTNFFPTITFPRVKGIFQQLGYSPAAATILALLCTEAPRKTVSLAGKKYFAATGPRALPQGACTSPALSNLAARRMDARLSGIANKLSWTYTRYADDLTFSADAEPAARAGYLLARLRHIAQDEGFAVNEKKTRIQRKNASQQVTGIVVNERRGVPRKLVRRLRAILHRARHDGLAAQERGRPRFQAWLRGMISYIHMVNPEQARPLQVALDSLGSH